jgi:hypothetical protein
MNAYTYNPLLPGSTEIRVLTLLRGSWDAEIVCRLQHVRLDEKPSYEALSYTWGDAKDLLPIIFEGTSCNVTRNLAVALRYLRSVEKERVLWIDALCINQLDLEERAREITRMSDIYISAERVLAWTGEPSEDGYAAMDALEELFAFLNGLPSLDFSTSTFDDFRRAGLDVANINWNALINFLERPYWKRVWVVQELAACGFGPDEGDVRAGKGLIVCGSRAFPKGLFDLICILLSVSIKPGSAHSVSGFREPETSFTLRIPIPAFEMCSTLLQLDNERPDLDSTNISLLMYATRNFQATDPRDKVYALLGLSRHKSMVVPDYSRDIDSVLTGLIKTVIHSDRSLRCLTYNRQGSNKFGPSWIPDLYNRPIGEGPSWQDQNRHHKADGGLDIDVQFHENTLLLVKGIRLGPITVVVGPFSIDPATAAENPETRRQQRLSEEISMIGKLNEYAMQLSSAEEIDRYWRTLILDTDYSDIENPVTPAPERFGELLKKIFPRPQTSEEPTQSLDELRADPLFSVQLEQFNQNLMGAILSRCFIRTADGRMGLGPLKTRTGDIVTVLFGACRCIVLRPKDSNYELVGDAYLEGAMKGEIVKDYDGGSESRAEVFAIC